MNADELVNRWILKEYREANRYSECVPWVHLVACPEATAAVETAEEPCDYDTCWFFILDALVECPHGYSDFFHQRLSGPATDALEWMAEEGNGAP